jgi:hypothetical protein
MAPQQGRDGEEILLKQQFHHFLVFFWGGGGFCTPFQRLETWTKVILIGARTPNYHDLALCVLQLMTAAWGREDVMLGM